MKPILIIRVPKDAVDRIAEIKLKLYRSFRQYKVKVIYDNDSQVGFKLSVINPSLSLDEIVEKDILEILPKLTLADYTLKTKVWRYESKSLSRLIFTVLKARIKNFFYFGKWVD
jgi:hypothetical protein